MRFKDHRLEKVSTFYFVVIEPTENFLEAREVYLSFCQLVLQVYQIIWHAANRLPNYLAYLQNELTER